MPVCRCLEAHRLWWYWDHWMFLGGCLGMGVYAWVFVPRGMCALM